MSASSDGWRRTPANAMPIRVRSRRGSSSGSSIGAGSESSVTWSSTPSSPASITRSLSESMQVLQSRYADWKQSTKAFRQMRQERPHNKMCEAQIPIIPPTNPTVLEPLDRIVPETLRVGEVMLKVTQNKVAQRTFKVDIELAAIVWASKKSNKVPLYAIRDVRLGAEAQSYRHALQIADRHEQRWISIIYQTPKAYKAVHVIALTHESLQLWRDTLLAVLAQRNALLSGRVPAATMQSHWLSASWQRDRDALTLEDVARLLQRTNIQCSSHDLRTHFAAADRGRDGVLRFEAFQQFVAALKRRVDVENLFSERSTDGLLSLAAFRYFAQNEQAETWNEEEIARVFSRYAGPDGLSCDQFLAFLASKDNAPTNAARTARSSGIDESSESLTRPLCDYYISSSHNTYLVGGQWKGDSTVEGYVRALQQGARSVELDCWDGPHGQPQVTHGRTLTGKVPFDDVILAVAQYAFVASPYPLILSLEIHNDIVQQEAIAKSLRSHLGDTLVTSALKDVYPDTLPSPEQLRGRILVKFKNWTLIHAMERESEVAITDLSVDSTSTTTTTNTDYTESDGESILGQARGIFRQIKRPISKEEKRKVEHLMSPALTDLLVYTVGVHFRGINKKEVYAPEHVFSLSERKAVRMIRQNNADLIKHNVGHLMRVYPSLSTLSRLHSSSANFLPVDMWAAGCQLVALNWQTRDRGMEMNQAFFTSNYGGYRLKPEGLRVRSLLKNASDTVRVNLRVKIVSAQQLPIINDEESSAYIAMSVHVPMQWGKTAVRLLNSEGQPIPSFRTSNLFSGLAPIWNASCTVQFEVPAAMDPSARNAQALRQATRGLLDLCFLRFQVYNEVSGGSNNSNAGATPLASSMVNLGLLKAGYRHLPLYDVQLSRMLYATLFVHTHCTLGQ